MKFMLLTACLLLLLAAPVLAQQRDVFHDIAVEEDARNSQGLLPALAQDRDPSVRRRAIQALGRIQDVRSLPVFEAATADGDAAVREDAIFATGQLWSPSAEPLLVRLWSPARTTNERSVIVEAMGKCASGPGYSVVSEAARDPQAAVRQQAALAMMRIGNRASQEKSEIKPPGGLDMTLRPLLSDDSPAVRFAAAAAVFRLKLPGLAPELAERLRDEDPVVRMYAARAIGAAHETGDGAALQAVLDDPDWRVRVSALDALGALGGEAAVPAIARTFSAGNTHVALAALSAAISIGKGFSAAQALAVLSDPRPQVRAAGIRLLARVDQVAALPELEKRSADPDAMMREAVGKATGDLHGSQAAVKILKRLQQDPDVRVRETAVEARASLADPDAVESLLAALKDPDEVVAATAAEKLGALKEKRSEAGILIRLNQLRSPASGETMVTLVEALAQVGSSASEPFLKDLLADPDETVRKAAARTMTALTGRPFKEQIKIIMVKGAGGPPPSFVPESIALVHTTRGDFRIRLKANEAPGTVWNFASLARKHFYDGLTFHRVVPNFVVQGGDPRGDGSGGPGYTIRCEINRLTYGTGAVGMALSGKDTGGSQWFVTHSPQPHLDGRYTIFGQVEDGMEVVDAIQEGDRILSIDIQKPQGGLSGRSMSVRP